jgi:F-type H+-transporting ATPase subunit b
MLFIMSRFIIPRISEMIDLRKGQINDHLGMARLYRMKAKHTLTGYQAALDKATAKAAAALEKTKAELNKTVEAREAEVTKALTAKIARSEREIANSKERALREIGAAVKGLSGEILAKIGLPELDKGNKGKRS